MNQPSKKTLTEEYIEQQNRPWEVAPSSVFRFWTSENRIVGFQFYSLVASEYIQDENRLALDFPVGTILIVGPAARQLYDDFCGERSRATLVKADGEQILSVELRLRQPKK